MCKVANVEAYIFNRNNNLINILVNEGNTNSIFTQIIQYDLIIDYIFLQPVTGSHYLGWNLKFH